jgi:hypothetical protein
MASAPRFGSCTIVAVFRHGRAETVRNRRSEPGRGKPQHVVAAKFGQHDPKLHVQFA